MPSTMPGGGDGEEEGKKGMAFALEEYSWGGGGREEGEQEIMMHC